jgi:peptidoglycan/xylan/chitin deacetylase (PgdA/CDA1 family)
MIYAWPLLEKYGFSAIIFLVAGEIGGTNRWDHRFGEEIPLLGWDEIQELSTHGIQFGSHSTSHPLLTAIPPTEVVREAIRSRRIIEQGLKMPVRAFAYPHGGEDQVVRHIVGACGYIFGLSTQPGRCGLWAPLLALPRIEVSGSDRLNDFIAKLAEREPHRTHG